MKKVKNKEILIEKWEYAAMPAVKFTQQKIDCRGLISAGSCFSRNLNRWLMHFGLTELQMPWGILYNPFSITMEIIRLFDKVNWQNGIIYETDKVGKIIRCKDPWRTWESFGTISQLIEFNQRFDTLAKKIISAATGFLFTFGLSEVWSRGDDINIIVNQLPPSVIFKKNCFWQSRFASIDEVIRTISRLIKIVRKNCGGDIPIILTLSPVPLKYSFSGLSIREANNISKATILLVLHQISQSEENVYYFPVYEIVQALLEQNFQVWQEDGRHVTAEVVDFIAKQFVVNFGNDKMPTDSSSDFCVPFVNSKGKILGRLRVDGSVIYD